MPIILCRLCNAPTQMTATRLCDRCWELRSRIERDPELARKILNELATSLPPPRKHK